MAAQLAGRDAARKGEEAEPELRPPPHKTSNFASKVGQCTLTR